VTEGYDEPTSEFPSGRHGDDSVFYEGRGAQFSLTQPHASSPVDLQSDPYIANRMSELASCSNFAYVKRTTDDVSACVARREKPDRRKRSLVTRTRRSGHVEHTVVEELLTTIGMQL